VPLRRGASVLSALAHADALLDVPAELDGLPAGAPVEAELLRCGLDLDGALLLAGAPDPALDDLALALPVAFCEMAPAEAVALVRDGGCHAAAFAGPPDDPDGRLESLRLAEVEVVLAGDHLLRRVAVGPHGTPARRVLGALAGVCELVEARSDSAALAAVAAGHADCAVVALPAARGAGLGTIPLGRTSLDLVIRRGAADPAVLALLETLKEATP
jgi:hypothetical protein